MPPFISSHTPDAVTPRRSSEPLPFSYSAGAEAVIAIRLPQKSRVGANSAGAMDNVLVAPCVLPVARFPIPLRPNGARLAAL